jgi:hypothetical protein
MYQKLIQRPHANKTTSVPYSIKFVDFLWLDAFYRKDKDRRNMETLIDDRKIKDLFKQAIIEVIEEKKEVVHDLLVEVMEDIAMDRAIQDGENSGTASRDDVFQILEGKDVSA